MGRMLKNYEVYLDKLKLYAEACEIAIEYKDVDGDGVYVPTRRKVSLDKDLPESTEIAVLLHELGHSLDETLYDKKLEKKIDRAYKAAYDGRGTAAQRALVLQCEERAWLYGRSIAKKLRIPLGKWYDYEEKGALDSYKGDGV